MVNVSVQEKRAACGHGYFFFVVETAGALEVAAAADEELAVIGVVGSGFTDVGVTGGTVDEGGTVILVAVEAEEGVGKVACGDIWTRGSEV